MIIQLRVGLCCGASPQQYPRCLNPNYAGDDRQREREKKGIHNISSLSVVTIKPRFCLQVISSFCSRGEKKGFGFLYRVYNIILFSSVIRQHQISSFTVYLVTWHPLISSFPQFNLFKYVFLKRNANKSCAITKRKTVSQTRCNLQHTV